MCCALFADTNQSNWIIHCKNIDTHSGYTHVWLIAATSNLRICLDPGPQWHCCHSSRRLV